MDTVCYFDPYLDLRVCTPYANLRYTIHDCKDCVAAIFISDRSAITWDKHRVLAFKETAVLHSAFALVGKLHDQFTY